MIYVTWFDVNYGSEVRVVKADSKEEAVEEIVKADASKEYGARLLDGIDKKALLENMVEFPPRKKGVLFDHYFGE